MGLRRLGRRVRHGRWSLWRPFGTPDRSRQGGCDQASSRRDVGSLRHPALLPPAQIAEGVVEGLRRGIVCQGPGLGWHFAHDPRSEEGYQRGVYMLQRSGALVAFGQDPGMAVGAGGIHVVWATGRAASTAQA